MFHANILPLFTIVEWNCMTSTIQDIHSEVFGCASSHVVRAPGRVNLIGEHIDYLGGFVLPVAIDKSLHMAVSPSESGFCRFWSAQAGSDPVSVDLNQLAPRDGNQSWLNYCIGVMALLRESGVAELPGFNATIASDIPAGAGLSSSAALETATALVVSALSGADLSPVERALICQKAEHLYANVPCGIMDQLAVGCCVEGHALLLDCQDCSTQLVSIPDGTSIVVSDTRVKHALGDGEYRKRREDCEAALSIMQADSFRDLTIADLESSQDKLDERLFKRSRHAISEMERVGQFVTALEAVDETQMGSLLRESHNSLRDDFEVSCPELDLLVDAAYDFGVIGARMTGGGFGGSTISLVREDAAEDLVHYLKNSFQQTFGRVIEPFMTVASGGASVIQS